MTDLRVLYPIGPAPADEAPVEVVLDRDTQRIAVMVRGVEAVAWSFTTEQQRFLAYADAISFASGARFAMTQPGGGR
ncbi:hypothetical protein L1787_07625 [Acuticoccus sp. M5D2P5]|uniref:hypothetical protein n=1 Tax=Acuticoccus kalidii TaxID=2910977 RepID=UPI001F3C53C8|nr:hypothetical protein [Acuticoccus kalidii]MCF3933279.1 hypothetical protein [Acuticoccus kalidii]